MGEIKTEFLYAAIKDAQELIRFVDAKTAIGIAVIGAYAAVLFSMTENIIKYGACLDTLFWILFAFSILLILTCVIITARIIKPTNFPAENIKNQSGIPDLKFFVGEIEHEGLSRISFPFYNFSSSKLSKSLETHIKNLDSADDKIIQKILSFEMLKVNYIKNIKNERYNILFTVILITSTVFFLFFIIPNKWFGLRL